mmetsp:Transcript_14897/g.18423  ORF Transcript_14897/g.18423 Transcript_14897/m.18423 type:complete len:248 (-) Transcript_14897:214-957(-)
MGTRATDHTRLQRTQISKSKPSKSQSKRKNLEKSENFIDVNEIVEKPCRIEYDSGDIYCGNTMLGKRHGYGKYVWTNGNSYAGDWHEGKMNGKGRFIWACGDVYQGDFVHGVISGNGTKVFANGDRFTGKWKANKPHGYGVKLFGCGDRFEGLYRENKRQGYGKYVWAGGDHCEGLWEDDSINGLGIIGTRSTIYQGEVLNGTPNGRGCEKNLIGNQFVHVDGVWVKGTRQYHVSVKDSEEATFHWD